MNEDFWLLVPVVGVWTALAVAYALAPWGDMIGYAWVWGAGAVVFALLAVALTQRPQQSGHTGDAA